MRTPRTIGGAVPLMDRLLANYENGNLEDAKSQAKRVSWQRIYFALRERGKPEAAAVAIAEYLKNPSRDTWQRACRIDNPI